jgi:phosphosulfolactate synthase
MFDAPRKEQQVWFIRRFGPEVNLSNVPVGEVLALETLRRGLRSDTLDVNRRRSDEPDQPPEG